MRSADPVVRPLTLTRAGGLGLVAVLAVCAPRVVRAADVSPDAVILVWEQRWTQQADGALVYHERKHVQLNDERAYREFADPRITYHADNDRLEILVGRVRRPDGTYRELPPYAHVEVSPDASAGWPAFARIRQHLLVMSGIEPGCVVELEYRVTSRPGSRRPLAADLRLDHAYPVVQRLVEVSVPAGTELAHVSRNTADHVFQEQAAPDGRRTYRWIFRDLSASPDEPQASPWPARCPRLAFSVAGSAEHWLASRLAWVEAAADSSDTIRKLAAEWAQGQRDPRDIVRAIQQRLATTFNLVEFDVSWRPAALRPASEVVESNYGLPEEAAALFLALVRAAGVTARPVILVQDDVWLARAPQDGMVAAWAIRVSAAMDAAGQETPGPSDELWEARAGRITREGSWAGCRVLSGAATGPAPEAQALPPWRSASESQLIIGGKVRLADDGGFTAEVTLRTSGLFAASEKLRTFDAQKERVAALVGRVLPEVAVESFAVSTLTDGRFDVSARVKSSRPLRKVGGQYLLQLPQDGPFLADVPLTLAWERRRCPVRIPGPFEEHVDLSFELPAGWTIELAPNAVARREGAWGAVEQAVESAGGGLILRRAVSVIRPELLPEEFNALRAALNTLRSDAARTAVLLPGQKAR